ncbi:hypothetical protein [Streptomyces exfoliatus]|uniref:hypothetical protein n=1 Tax=Streptomyces exfoliatus TaxID=1905 RepID=UPI003C2F1CF5
MRWGTAIPPRPYAAAFRGLIALSAATGLVIEGMYASTASDLRHDGPETGFRLSARVG